MKRIIAAALIGFACVATAVSAPAQAQEERPAERKSTTAPQQSDASKKQAPTKKAKAGKSAQKSKATGKKSKKAPAKKTKKGKN